MIKLDISKLKLFSLLNFFFSISFVLCLCGRPYIPSAKSDFYSNLSGWLANLKGWGVMPAIAVIFVFMIYQNVFPLYVFSKASFCLSALFTCFMLTGNSFKFCGSLRYLYSDTFGVFQTMFCLLGYIPAFYCILLVIENKIFADTFAKEAEPATVRRSFLIKRWAIILLSYVPYYIISFPGSVEYDYGTALLQYYGHLDMTNAIPVLQTWLLVFFIELGRFLGNENTGIAIYSFIQMCVLSFLFAYTLYLMKKASLDRKILNIVNLVYIFVPIFPLYAITIGKDVNFGIVILVSGILIFKMCVSHKDFNKNIVNPVLLCISLILAALFRNAGIFIVFLLIPVVLFLMRAEYKRYILISAVVLFFLGFWNKILLPGLKFKEADRAEYMSIMFQQTARYVKNHEPEEWEKEAIGKVLDYDTLATSYDPQISDPVKDRHKKDFSDADFKEYKKAYWHGFCKKPLCYIQAFLNLSYGYYYPDCKGEKKIYVVSGFAGNFAKTTNPACNLDLHNSFPKLLNILNVGVNRLRNFPLFGLFCSSGFYSWILTLSLVFMLRKNQKRKYAFVFLPALFLSLGLLATPVNAYMRYSIPLIFSAPFLFMTAVSKPQEGI